MRTSIYVQKNTCFTAKAAFLLRFGGLGAAACSTSSSTAASGNTGKDKWRRIRTMVSTRTKSVKAPSELGAKSNGDVIHDRSFMPRLRLCDGGARCIGRHNSAVRPLRTKAKTPTGGE